MVGTSLSFRVFLVWGVPPQGRVGKMPSQGFFSYCLAVVSPYDVVNSWCLSVVFCAVLVCNSFSNTLTALVRLGIVSSARSHDFKSLGPSWLPVLLDDMHRCWLFTLWRWSTITRALGLRFVFPFSFPFLSSSVSWWSVAGA